MDANPGVMNDTVEAPEVQDSFFHQALPKPLPSQLAILNLVSEMIKKDNRTLTYVCWPCGLGKSTTLLEWGNILGVNCLPKRGNKTVTVRLVVANDLVAHYKQAFTEKQDQADKRITFEWLSMTTLKQKLQDCPSAYIKDIILADEGDTLLVREIN